MGDNPYVRMIRAHMDAECNICQRPFTVFKWKAGTEGRVKSTIICPTCAQAKSACQTCLFDLVTGLPLQVRDALLKNHGVSGGMDLIRPQSDQMLRYQTEQTQKALAGGSGISPLASQVLQGLAKTTPDYRKNRARICSFYLKGTCNRGDSCPFRHEQSDHTDATLAAQNIKDRYYGTDDPLAKKILERVTDSKNAQTTGPEVSTVWVAGVVPEKKITEQDIKDHFYSFGEIVKIRMVPTSKCAFVEFVSHDQASRAIDALRNNLVIRGQFLKVGWAKPQANRADRVYTAADASSATSAPPPPGFVPYNPIAPGAPPPGAAGPLGWAPIYYPSMNPQRMGAIDPSSSASSSHAQESSNAKSRPQRPTSAQQTHQIEEPDSATSTSAHTSDNSHSTVNVSEVKVEENEVAPGARVKRPGGSDHPKKDTRSTKKSKV
jgi:pre-mRNA-splicing factor RBM22/SLT11